MIYLQQTYTNDAGVSIYCKVPAEPEPGDEARAIVPQVGFFADAVLPLQLPTGQAIQLQFQFKVPGDTLKAAFANFLAALEQARTEAVKNFQSEQRKSALMNGVGRFNGK